MGSSHDDGVPVEEKPKGSELGWLPGTRFGNS
jgi:hypothetical protein